MYQKKAMIMNQSGLHAWPAMVFVECAQKFACQVNIARASETDLSVNAQSMVMLLTLGLCKGDEALIWANGPDERLAVDSLIDLIQSGFGEI